MKHFNVKGINYIAVEVPETSYKIEIRDNDNRKTILCGLADRNMSFTKDLSKGNYSIIGTTPLSEEQCREIVECKVLRRGVGYKDYNFHTDAEVYPFLCATMSFQTLLDRESITGKNVIIKVEKQNGNKTKNQVR